MENGNLNRIGGLNDVKSDPFEEFLRTEYGIDNIMEYEFDDLKDKDRSDFLVSLVRGNMQLKKGEIRTFKESEERFHRVRNLDFKRLLDYKP